MAAVEADVDDLLPDFPRHYRPPPAVRSAFGIDPGEIHSGKDREHLLALLAGKFFERVGSGTLSGLVAGCGDVPELTLPGLIAGTRSLGIQPCGNFPNIKSNNVADSI